MPIDPNAAICVTAFAWVPKMARGHVRDLRVRWALEEAGIAYRTRLLELDESDGPEHRARQPFGQVPVYEEGDVVLFESAAIVHHVAERSTALLPADPAARARAVQWMFAALNSIEPFVIEVQMVDLFHAGEEWATLRRPSAVEFLQGRLGALAERLGDGPYLEGDRFTAGDLLMATVLRDTAKDVMETHPTLIAYVERCKARPAFQAALAAQYADFRPTQPGDPA